jgi:hypothetical protein
MNEKNQQIIYCRKFNLRLNSLQYCYCFLLTTYGGNTIIIRLGNIQFEVSIKQSIMNSSDPAIIILDIHLSLVKYKAIRVVCYLKNGSARLVETPRAFRPNS